MVSKAELDHLIDRAGRHSSWEDVHVDVHRVARTARVQHAAEVLVQLGHDHLAQELLRSERECSRARLAEVPPAA